MSAALIAAAFEEVDSTPMEGFDPAALDDILDRLVGPVAEGVPTR